MYHTGVKCLVVVKQQVGVVIHGLWWVLVKGLCLGSVHVMVYDVGLGQVFKQAKCK